MSRPPDPHCIEAKVKRNIAKKRREWLEKAHRRNPRCHYCGNLTELKSREYNQFARHNEEMIATLDHAVPKSYGGTEWEGNYRLACAICNSLKGTMSEREYIAELEAAGVRAA